MRMTSPGASRRALVTRAPFTNVPFVEPASSTHRPSGRVSSVAWRPETVVSLSSLIAFSAPRPTPAVLVSSMIFQLFTGLMNTAQFYPWKFFFTTTHYAMSYVIVAALMVHIAVKLPIIQAAFRTPLESTEAIDNDPTTPTPTDADADAEEVTR